MMTNDTLLTLVLCTLSMCLMDAQHFGAAERTNANFGAAELTDAQ